MQLKLSRSQREGGTFSKSVIFCLDARVQLTQDEQASVNRYRLGSQVIYNSEASKRQVEAGAAAMAQGAATGGLKAIAAFALARLHLNITINSLQQGQHIECKDLDEVLEAEDALMSACKNLRSYLETAATFDGREVLIDFDQGEPVVAAASTVPLQLAAPPAADAPKPTVLNCDAPPSPAYAPAAAATVDSFSELDNRAGSHAPFEIWLERQKRNWAYATGAQKAAVMAGGLFVLYVLAHIL